MIHHSTTRTQRTLTRKKLQCARGRAAIRRPKTARRRGRCRRSSRAASIREPPSRRARQRQAHYLTRRNRINSRGFEMNDPLYPLGILPEDMGWRPPKPYNRSTLPIPAKLEDCLLGRLVIDADQLERISPPRFSNGNKQMLYQLACSKPSTPHPRPASLSDRNSNGLHNHHPLARVAHSRGCTFAASYEDNHLEERLSIRSGALCRSSSLVRYTTLHVATLIAIKVRQLC